MSRITSINVRRLLDAAALSQSKVHWIARLCIWHVLARVNTAQDFVDCLRGMNFALVVRSATDFQRLVGSVRLVNDMAERAIETTLRCGFESSISVSS